MFDQERDRMVEEQMAARDIRHPAVLEAMRRVPRHAFVPPDLWDRAYADAPLPIGSDQTISQPYMVALMSQALVSGSEQPESRRKVLEIGTGSGYQTAVLCELFDEVYTIERHGELSERAAAVLGELGYANVHFKIGDGTRGWPSQAPFDAVIVTASAPQVPAPLMNQLNVDHGRLLVPVGSDADNQELVMMERTPQTIRRVSFGDVRFVPLIGQHGW